LEFQRNQLLTAHGHEQRLKRLWKLQTSACKSQLPKVMAILWDLEEEHINDCLDYEVGIVESVSWVHRIQGDLNTEAFPSALGVWRHMTLHIVVVSV
jgi:hypothetical protein